MAETTRRKGADGGSSARTGAEKGPRQPRFELSCATCGRAIAVSIAPEECPACRGSVWEYHPPATDRPCGWEGGPSRSFETIARKVIGSSRVRRWRFDQLLRAGYPAGDAFVLSGRSDVDLHQAIGLLRKRCAISTAMRILI